jgi:acetyltransferase-like isoleucine patch superfamily enzyme
METKQRINSAKDIQIGDHVWLGADAKIMKGSMIEDNAIIATGAIITNHVESNSIYAGVPARKVKEDIFWKRER